MATKRKWEPEEKDTLAAAALEACGVGMSEDDFLQAYEQISARSNSALKNQLQKLNIFRYSPQKNRYYWSSYAQRRTESNVLPQEPPPEPDLMFDSNPCSPISAILRRRLNESDRSSLFLLPCPTGLGKTYATIFEIYHILKTVARSGGEWPADVPERIYYITDLISNVMEPYRLLNHFIARDAELSSAERERIKSTVAAVPKIADIVSKITSGQIRSIYAWMGRDVRLPVTQCMAQLSDKQNIFKHLLQSGFPLSSAAKKLHEDEIDKIASALYGQILRDIRGYLRGRTTPLDATEATILRPILPGLDVEAGTVRVIFMTTQKLMHGFDGLRNRIKPVLSEHNCTFFFDEYDKQNKTILDFLIEADPEDIITTLRTLDNNLSRHRVQVTQPFQGVQDVLDRYIAPLTQFAQDWHLNATFGLSPELMNLNREKITLFSDKMALHASAVDDFLTVSYSPAENRNIISRRHVPAGENATPVQGVRPRSLISFLRRGCDLAINHCAHHFRNASDLVLNNLTEQGQGLPLRVNLSTACFRVLNQVNLGDFRDKISERFYFNQARRITFGSTPPSYHTRGLQLTEIKRIPDDPHPVKCDLHSYELSPTAVIAGMVLNGNQVFGISATAESASVLHNFDGGYLRATLGDRFQTPDAQEIESIAAYLSEQRNYQRAGVSIQVKTTQPMSVFDQEAIRQGAQDPDCLIAAWFNLVNPRQEDYARVKGWIGSLMDAMNSFMAQTTGRYFVAFLSRHIRQDALKEFLRVYVGYLETQYAAPAKIFPHVDARFIREKKYDNEIISALSNSSDKIIVITTYQTLGAGSNVHYPFSPQSRELLYVGSESAPTECRTDIDSMYLEEPTSMFAVPVSDRDETPMIDHVMEMLHSILSLHESGEVGHRKALEWIDAVIKAENVAALNRIQKRVSSFYIKETRDYQHAVWRAIQQAIGRASRTPYKQRVLHFYLHEPLCKTLAQDDRNDPLFIDEYKAVLDFSRRAAGSDIPVNFALQRQRNIADRNNRRTAEWINGRIRNIIWNQDQVEYWQAIKERLLRHPTMLVEDIALSHFYLSSPTSGYYFFSHTGDTMERMNEYVFFPESLRGAQEVSEAASRLPILMANPAIRAHFLAQGYAVAWEPWTNIMTPVAFQALYLGTLGEVVGRQILRERGCAMTELPLEHYELFDNVGTYEGVPFLVDFKYWNLENFREMDFELRRSTLQHILSKARQVGINKAIVCNILASCSDEIRYYTEDGHVADASQGVLVEVPGLVNVNNSNILEESIAEVLRWIAEKGATNHG